jgi:hypothetical protein
MGRKGTKSRTHFGRKNYTTKRGDKVYHYKGHYVKKHIDLIHIVKAVLQEQI